MNNIIKYLKKAAQFGSVIIAIIKIIEFATNELQDINNKHNSDNSTHLN